MGSAVLAAEQRLAAVRRTELALPAWAASADAVARLAARSVAAHAGLVTLVRDDNIHLAGVFGAPPTIPPSRELPLSASLCPIVVSTDSPFVVDDISTHPECGEFDTARYGVRAYLGVPVRDARGQALGALAAFDAVPRDWAGDDLMALLELAELVGPLPEGDPLTDRRVSLATVLDVLGEALIGIDHGGAVSAWNMAAQEMFGWSQAEALDCRIDQLAFDRVSWARMRAAAARAAAAPTVQRLRSTARHRDGHVFPVETITSMIETPAGPRWAVVALDAAERAEADRHAAQQAAFLQAVLDNLYTGVAACDADGRVVLINRALRQAHGLSADEPAIDPTTLYPHLFRPDGTHLPRADSPLMRALAGELVRDAALVIRPADAPARTYLANATPIRDAGGRTTGAVAAVHDVTAQRRAERFRACELRVATALAGADTVRAVGSLITQVVAETLGWPHVELWLADELGDGLRRAGHWTDPRLRTDAPLSHTVTRGVGITGTVWATGLPLWVPDIAHTEHLVTAASVAQARACAQVGARTVAAVPIHDGTTVGVLTCFAHTPEYEEAELISRLEAVARRIGLFVARRRAVTLAAQLDRTRDDFIALVGHELRTPLTSIGSYTELLLAEADGLDPDVAQMLDGIHRNTASLTAIVDDLLDLAALQGGHVAPTPRPTDAVTALRESLDRVARAADANRVTITADVPDHLIIDVDPQRFRQVLDNLLSNAVKYSPDGGTVSARLTTDGDAAVLTVTDTGIGIPPEERTHMFRNFFRATNARHSTIPGTGLGLVITRAIVEAHGGAITATHNHPGTSLTIRLPVRRARR
ncbi:MAG TPA: ATP-binding protein [Pilimelia sp.]|nr:ATP-binding protein [Pilimelia sp.]